MIESCICDSFRTKENKETVPNQVPPKGEVQREQTEMPVYSRPERDLLSYFKDVARKSRYQSVCIKVLNDSLSFGTLTGLGTPQL